MKKNLITLICLIICAFIYAQDSTTITHDSTIVTTVTDGANQLPQVADWFTKGMPVIMGALTILFGYFSKWIPVFKNIQEPKYRVLAFAVLLGAGFMYFGASIWQVAMAYAGSTSLYELAIKEMFGSSWHFQQKISK